MSQTECHQTGAIVSHHIGWPWDVSWFGDIAVVALVDAVQPEQVGSWSRGGGGVLVVPHNHGDIVTQGDDSATVGG